MAQLRLVRNDITYSIDGIHLDFKGHDGRITFLHCPLRLCFDGDTVNIIPGQSAHTVILYDEETNQIDNIVVTTPDECYIITECDMNVKLRVWHAINERPVIFVRMIDCDGHLLSLYAEITEGYRVNIDDALHYAVDNDDDVIHINPLSYYS